VIDANGREWEVRTEAFDFGRLWGVAIESAEPIDFKVRRGAVRVPAGITTEAEAIARALPQLREWADSEGWAHRK
jgi:hypothetical protein